MHWSLTFRALADTGRSAFARGGCFIVTSVLSSILLATSVSASPEPPEADPSRGVVVYVQPLGDGLTQADVDAAVQALVAELGAVVRVLPVRPLPQSAYFPARDRYRAEKLLDSLEPLLPPDGDRILGVTARDISTTRGARADWGMVGLASFTRPVGVVSTFRCLRGAKGPAQARERLAKIAVHEVGHTLGLQHCIAPGCLMRDARGRVSICERMDGLCPRCRARLKSAAWAVPLEPVAPWCIRRG